LGSRLDYRLTPKLNAQLNYSWQQNSYTQETTAVDPDTLTSFTAKRRDDIDTWGVSLNYRLRRNLTLQGGFSTAERSSNFKNNEYVNNTYTFSSNYEF
jgi:outer membrane receptor for ferrienterochelin and colicin